ncbi:MAG: GntR family transcriptional regulator [Lentisphaerota bacterium]
MSVPLSKAEQVKQAIMEMIVREKMTPGAQFPTEGELTERLSVSRVTVRKAMNSLSDQGVFLRTKGKGTCISPDFESAAAGCRSSNTKTARRARSELYFQC